MSSPTARSRSTGRIAACGDYAAVSAALSARPRCAICAADSSCRASSIRTFIFRRCASWAVSDMSFSIGWSNARFPKKRGSPMPPTRLDRARIRHALAARHHYGAGFRFAFQRATAALFKPRGHRACGSFSGLVLSDRGLRPNCTSRRRPPIARAAI